MAQSAEPAPLPAWRRLLAVPAPIEWLCLAVGCLWVLAYAWILDDAYVYFRYADNALIKGVGLVYNPGEYVEGFSSALWMVYLLALRWLGLNYWVIIQATAVASFVVFWAAAIAANRKLAPADSPRSRIANYPLVHLTFTYGVACYFSSGLETPFVLLSAVFFWCAILWPRNVWLLVAIGIAPLARHEFALPWLMFVAWRLSKRHVPWATLIAAALVVGGWLVFRVTYYADWVPLTFHLKDIQWIQQGLNYVADTALPYKLPAFLVALVAGVVLARRRGMVWGAGGERALAVAMALGLTAYVIKIGGDPRHFRYLAFPYCLFLLALGSGTFERIAQTFAWRRAIGPAAMLSVAAVMTASYPAQLLAHPWVARFDLAPSEQGYHAKVEHINDAQLHRATHLTPPWLTDGQVIESHATRSEPFRRVEDGAEVFAAGFCKRIYEESTAWVVHHWGLTEPFLARADVPSSRPAHKPGLIPMAKELVAIRQHFGFRKGAFRAAVEAGAAPGWVQRNLAALEDIEARVYNDHDFFANLRMILKGSPKVLTRP